MRARNDANLIVFILGGYHCCSADVSIMVACQVPFGHPRTFSRVKSPAGVFQQDSVVVTVGVDRGYATCCRVCHPAIFGKLIDRRSFSMIHSLLSAEWYCHGLLPIKTFDECPGPPARMASVVFQAWLSLVSNRSRRKSWASRNAPLHLFPYGRRGFDINSTFE